jgi:hypothetical protein
MSILGHTQTVNDFQKNIMLPILHGLFKKQKVELFAHGLENIDNTPSLYISNHRDIVLDPSLLGYLLMQNNFPTVEVAIGSNLLIEPWITDVVKINKSFVVKRDVSGRDLLLASKKMSEYIRFALQEKKHPVWIAQREGRAKDGNDKTQSSLIKMLHLGAKHIGVLESYKQLHIVPVSITYEYDSCDVLKAKELYLNDRGEKYIKKPEDDMLSMKYGIVGLTARICYHFGKPIEYDDMSGTPDFNSIAEKVAQKIDNTIYENYKLFPSHYISYDLLNEESVYSDFYSAEDKKNFLELIQHKIEILLPEYKDNEEFKKFVFIQYANILQNKLLHKTE